ncbi:MAG TPA: hypothetical protein VGD33_10015 [Chitinophagaceae bacterium]
MAFWLLKATDIVMEQPGQAKLTEGFHAYSVDVMNTSFLLVNDEDNKLTDSLRPQL